MKKSRLGKDVDRLCPKTVTPRQCPGLWQRDSTFFLHLLRPGKVPIPSGPRACPPLTSPMQQAVHGRLSQHQDHISTQFTRLKNTAALPMSFARFANGCLCCCAARSTHHSSPELSNSTINTNSTLPIINALPTRLTGSSTATGTSTNASNISCRKASSCFHVEPSPSME